MLLALMLQAMVLADIQILTGLRLLEEIIFDALEAVADYGDSNESDSDNTGLSTILRPRGIADQSFFRIDV